MFSQEETRFIPIYEAQAPAIQAALDTSGSVHSEGFLSTIGSVLTSIGSSIPELASKYLGLQMLKKQASLAESRATQLQLTRELTRGATPPGTPGMIAGIPSWLLIGGLGFGAFMMLRGKGKPGKERRRRK